MAILRFDFGLNKAFTFLEGVGKCRRLRRLNVNGSRATEIFFLLALQPPLGVVFYSPLASFSLLAYEVS